LTCDTGITAHEAVAYANSQGVDVIVTDHHDLPSTLPEACAIINPKLLPVLHPSGESHPLATLPGVGVAYKLVEALFDRAGSLEEAFKHLDLVALGIVADLAARKLSSIWTWLPWGSWLIWPRRPVTLAIYSNEGFKLCERPVGWALRS
jgi:single-stranded-DNA-specific exonuclease